MKKKILVVQNQTKTQGTNINFHDKYDLENSKPDIREVFFIKIFSMSN